MVGNAAIASRSEREEDADPRLRFTTRAPFLDAYA
jgi:hypothetical protein